VRDGRILGRRYGRRLRGRLGQPLDRDQHAGARDRAERPHREAQSQLVSGGLLCVEFLLPFAIWQTALYRIDQWDTRIVEMLNDMPWLIFLGIISSDHVPCRDVPVSASSG
jgi:hypothetical protein